MAGLALRRPGHAPLRPGRRAVRCRAIGCYRHAERDRRLVQLVDPGGVSGWLGARRRFLRADRRPHWPQPRSLLDHNDVCAIHGIGLLRTNVVATVDRPLPGGARHRRRVGGGGLAAFGDMAAAVAALDCRGAPERCQRRRFARFSGDVCTGRSQAPRRVPGRPAASAFGIVDTVGGSRNRRMERGQARGRGEHAGNRRAVPRRGAAHGRARHPGLLDQPDGALGFHFLVSATLEELARRDRLAGRARTRSPAWPIRS